MNPLPTLLIGCGAMGKAQARIIASLPMYRLIAVADVVAEAAAAVATEYGCAHGTDVAALLAQHRPAVVAICTGNDTHARYTIQAAQAGVRGIHCEKPMAVHLDDARAMVAACAASGTRLIINHQRRTGADLIAMKRAIDGGAIGTVRRIRVQCAGDILSDGTHCVDSLRFLAGDSAVEWVLGAVHRGDPALKPPPKDTRQARKPGWRFGHPVEDGGHAQIQFASGIRGEVLCGDQVEGYCAYQHYEVIGTTGRLWRVGDGKPCAASGKAGPATWDPHIFISDGQPGTHAAVFDPHDWPYRAKPCPGGAWRVLEPAGDPLANLIAGSYQRLAEVLERGGDHPMDAAVGLADLELVTAIYASAQRHEKLALAALPGRFPLHDQYPA
jgi:predicted dehydrogenase